MVASVPTSEDLRPPFSLLLPFPKLRESPFYKQGTRPFSRSRRPPPSGSFVPRGTSVE